MTPLPNSDDETIALLKDAAATFLASEHSRERLRSIYEGRSALSLNAWRQFAEQGWLSLRWPEALGGAGLGLAQASVLAEQFGCHLVPEPFVTSAVMPAVLAERLAPSAAAPGWQAIADGCAGGRSLAAMAWQHCPDSLEPDTTTQAEPAGGAHVLNGSKHGVIAASVADAFLVTALLDGEPALWHIPRDQPGVSLRSHVTSDGSTVAVVTFTDVALHRDMLLARGPALREALTQAIDEGMLLMASHLIGMADAALELTLDFMRTRAQFGRHIGSFQALQHAAVDVRLQLVLARAARHAAICRHAAAPSAAETRAAIAAAKARASDAALLSGRFGVQMHGAIGFAAESDIGLYLKSALRLAACLGNGSQQRERYGRLTGIHETNQ